MLQWIKKHYIVSLLIILILILCALHLNGTRNEKCILPKQGIILEKDITVDINRNPNAILTVINASNYPESYAIDVLPIMKKYNCYIFDYLIVNDELYLLARSNDTISNMNLYPLLILRVTDTSLTANVIGYDFDKFSASLDYINGNIIASNREGKYILDATLSATKIVDTDPRLVQQKNESKHGIKNDKVIFNSIIVITDRLVLDKQLQDTIYQFEHVEGVVVKIDNNASQLADALNTGKKIIITTLQKFPFILEKVDDLSGKRFAIIVDEAHSSQTGEASKKMKAILGDTEGLTEEEQLQKVADEEAKEEHKQSDSEDEITKEMATHGRLTNLSFFAFTATPKAKTLEMFGTPDANGIPRAFHIYSMKQAIQEGFILDVLKNYVTYDTYFKIGKKIADDPRYEKSKANKALGKFLSLHPHNLAQKTQIIVEHFRTVTKNKIGGKAKAMVVTGSRLHAVRYYQEFQRYIKKKRAWNPDCFLWYCA